MTGLNLEAFLKLHRADWGAWLSLGVIVGVLALMAWTSFGRRRALRKCLVLSVAAHIGLVAYGGALPIVGDVFRGRPAGNPEPTTSIKVNVTSSSELDDSPQSGGSGRKSGRRSDFDQPTESLGLADPASLATARPDAHKPVAIERQTPVLEVSAAAPSLESPALAEPTAPALDPTPDPNPTAIVAADPNDVAPAPSPRPAISNENGSGPLGEGNLRNRVRQTTPAVGSSNRPQRSQVAIAAAVAPNIPLTGMVADPATQPLNRQEAPIPTPTMATIGVGTPVEPPKLQAAAESENDSGVPEADLRRQTRPGHVSMTPVASKPDRASLSALARVTPSNNTGLGSGISPGVPNGFVPIEIPKIYRSRLDPKRSELAQKAGASLASEEAVERALDWLKRHQDSDGRWNGGTAKYDDGRVVARDENFTSHCPLGDLCAGECLYHDADTAITGLALLAYLGAGYTHIDGGKYSETVGSGLDSLIRAQKADGDLRGQSTAVGMYCHAMATLALSEAYALTGDRKLRPSVERAVGFLVRGQATDGMAWRYTPRASSGDTSILGWVILVLKSAGEVGVPVPALTRSGAIKWLGMVGDGKHGGLAKYQPNKPVTPTMTAEAWVCRQFLGVGGPGLASNEAADYLIKHGPNTDPYNLYYWYYGTLALFQHGGPTWDAWNTQVRDQLVRRQRTNGHAVGSWDPDQTEYGVLGGRIYATAVATLTLEVYYRYLRLDELPTPRTDGSTRRAGGVGLGMPKK